MNVAILSDIHDHIWNLEKTISQLQGKVEVAIFCGDMTAPFTSGILSQLDIPTYACLGNNDEDHIGLLKKAGPKFVWKYLSEEFGKVELGGKKIAFCHYPKLAELLAKTGDFDAIFYGHTHLVDDRQIGNTLLVNPGPICGIQNGKSSRASYAIYDSAINKVKTFSL